MNDQIKQRLEYLRGELKAERISYGELAELQGLAEHIPAGDVELLEAAGVSEDVSRALNMGVLLHPIPASFPVQPLQPDDEPEGKATCGYCGLSWDDHKPTTWTPAPAGRCPFENFHKYPND